MSFMTNVGKVLNLASFALGGEGTAQRQFILSSDDDKLILPVTPWKYDVKTGQGNKVVGVEQLGEALVFGLPKAVEISFSCFFPDLNHEYPFVVGDEKSPADCVALLTKWKEGQKPVRIIITDSPVNLLTGIMRFDYKEKDGTRDIYYTLELTEYKDLNTPDANNPKKIDEQTGLKGRPANPTDATRNKLKKASDMLDKAKHAYGQYNKWRRIAESAKNGGWKDLAVGNLDKLRKLKIPKLPKGMN